MRFPLPDPLGILESFSNGLFFDPILSKKQDEITGQPLEQGSVPVVGFDAQVDDYLGHLYKAYRVAPCTGCKDLVESAIVGAEVYRAMQTDGLTLDQVRTDDSKVTMIREKVKKQLNII